jgi:23S rRNA pseudouridine2605 synthase
MRLNQFLARAGYGSRRKCEELILQGMVTLNGRVVHQLATRVGPKDAVKVGSKLAQVEQELVAVLNKPMGYVCTTPESTHQKTIFELIPRDWPRVFYVGRLDMDSEGLLLITNNGPLAQKLTHPKYKMPKTYVVALDRVFDFNDVEKLKKGLMVEDVKGRFDAVFRLGPKAIKVVLTQGLKRQIRVMLGHLGYEVKKLVRIKIGSLEFPELPSGSFQILTDKEVQSLTKGLAEKTPEELKRPRRVPFAKKSARPFRPRPKTATRTEE